MQRKFPAHAVAGLIGLFLSGCFVIDEIDQGQKIMDDHSPKAKEEKEEAPKKSAARAGGRTDAVDNYFREEAQDGTTKSFAPGEVSEGIVACKLADGTQFMKRENCAARGGHSD